MLFHLWWSADDHCSLEIPKLYRECCRSSPPPSHRTPPSSPNRPPWGPPECVGQSGVTRSGSPALASLHFRAAIDHPPSIHYKTALLLPLFPPPPVQRAVSEDAAPANNVCCPPLGGRVFFCLWKCSQLSPHACDAIVVRLSEEFDQRRRMTLSLR
jgi:hypothetical protein